MEGSKFKIEYRWADDQPGRLPAMAADLVHREVAVIAATSSPAAVAAKAATTKIPIVFEIGSDPIQLGLVTSLSRPGGNVTGVTRLAVEVAQKRLELLHQLFPTARVMALLVNPAEPTIAKATASEVLVAARTFGLEVHVLNASSESDFDEVFAKLVQLKASALIISGGPFFVSHREQLAALTAPPRRAHGFPVSRVRRGRRLFDLRVGYCRFISAGWHLYRADSQGRQARRTAGPTGRES